MRRFSIDYLDDTRAGLWADRSVLAPLAIDEHDVIVDVGCGTGSLTEALRAEASADTTIIGLDADPTLLERVDPPSVLGDARRLPIRHNSVDLVTCQALLVNLADPTSVVREFSRVSRDLVAVIEPDNSAVAVDSTAPMESALAQRARAAYLDGIETDVTLGSSAEELLKEAGLTVVSSTVHHHHRVVEPPYSEGDLESARRKVLGSRISDARETLLAGDMDEETYDALLADWRAMGRTVVDQMEATSYRRAEVVPFHIVVGRVSH